MTLDEKIALAQSLGRSGSSVGGFELDPVPQLGGRFAAIDPTETERFNRAWREWKDATQNKLAEELAQSI